MKRIILFVVFIISIPISAYPINVNISCSQPWPWVFVANDKYFIESFSSDDNSIRHVGEKEYFDRFKDKRSINGDEHFVNMTYERTVVHAKAEWQEKARKPTKEYLRVDGGTRITIMRASFDEDGLLSSSDNKTFSNCITNADPRK